MQKIKSQVIVFIVLPLFILIFSLFTHLKNDWLVQNIKTVDKELTKDTIKKLKVGEKQAFIAPDITNIPKDALGESILRRKNYLENTIETLPHFVKAKMNCTSCHLNSGTKQFAGPWVGITGRFPQYRSRSAKVDTLQDRVNDCFERSLNGTRLPENSSYMTDIIAYMTWLSKDYSVGHDVEGSGMPKLKLERTPNIENGKTVYANKCASCHQANGQGFFATDGKTIYPALWGKDSLNVGAGMARLYTAAGFVKTQHAAWARWQLI